MRVAFAGPDDLDFLDREDHHVDRDVIRGKVARREIMVAYVEDRPVGFLRHGYFWDEIPFMNLLWVEEPSRGKGYGTQLVSFWEREMRKLQSLKERCENLGACELMDEGYSNRQFAELSEKYF